MHVWQLILSPAAAWIPVFPSLEFSSLFIDSESIIERPEEREEAHEK